MGRGRVEVAILYPTDPAGASTGGIDTFIRGELQWAPSFLRYTVVGSTTDESARPVGAPMPLPHGHGGHRHLPILRQSQDYWQSRVPLSLRYSFALLAQQAPAGMDAFECHRIEPLFAVRRRGVPTVSIVHHYPPDVFDPRSDNRWRYWPKTYVALDRRTTASLDRVFCVRSESVSHYARLLPQHVSRFSEIDTWADRALFRPASSAEERRALRQRLSSELNFDPEKILLVTVGRIDRSKNPELLIDAFARTRREDLCLLWVGDGNLRAVTERRCAELGVSGTVRFAGVRPPADVAAFMKASDLFLFGSLYDAKPMAIAEALACGLPVATVDVGNVREMVHIGVSGEIADRADADALSEAVTRCISQLATYRQDEIVRSSGRFEPARSLAPLHEYYRTLGGGVD